MKQSLSYLFDDNTYDNNNCHDCKNVWHIELHIITKDTLMKYFSTNA
ncbi:MAG: hypothetical protein V8T35_02895 [Prevotella sp.]